MQTRGEASVFIVIIMMKIITNVGKRVIRINCRSNLQYFISRFNL